MSADEVQFLSGNLYEWLQDDGLLPLQGDSPARNDGKESAQSARQVRRQGDVILLPGLFGFAPEAGLGMNAGCRSSDQKSGRLRRGKRFEVRPSSNRYP